MYRGLQKTYFFYASIFFFFFSYPILVNGELQKYEKDGELWPRAGGVGLPKVKHNFFLYVSIEAFLDTHVSLAPTHVSPSVGR